jgi:hypothetical protein
MGCLLLGESVILGTAGIALFPLWVADSANPIRRDRFGASVFAYTYDNDNYRNRQVWA